MSVVSFALNLADPRGRCDRKGLLVVALALVAVEMAVAGVVVATGIGLDHPGLLAVKLACLWLATAVVSKRLHDLGLPATRMLWAALGVVAWSTVLALAAMLTLGDAAMVPGMAGYNIAVGGTVLPVLASTLWLHFARGESGANRFGPEPMASGFSHPAAIVDETGGLVPAAG